LLGPLIENEEEAAAAEWIESAGIGSTDRFRKGRFGAASFLQSGGSSGDRSSSESTFQSASSASSASISNGFPPEVAQAPGLDAGMLAELRAALAAQDVAKKAAE